MEIKCDLSQVIETIGLLVCGELLLHVQKKAFQFLGIGLEKIEIHFFETWQLIPTLKENC